jgi:thiol-disulfide isomerase/thioredoxin
MTVLLALARLLLGAVLLTAGAAKLSDRAGSRQAMLDFGVPGALASAAGVLLPVTEIALGVALIPRATAWWAAAGALALFLLFLGVIGYQLALGRRPDCHCFGQLHSAPIGRGTVLRNVGFVALAAWLVAQPGRDVGPGMGEWIGMVTAAEALVLAVALVALVLAAGQGWLLANLVRQNGRLLLRLDALEARLSGPAAPEPPSTGLPKGSPAPEFALPALGGGTMTLSDLRAAGKAILLVFVDPGCGPCRALLPEVEGWARQDGESLTIALMSRGTAEANRSKFDRNGPLPVLLQRQREVAERYGVSATPGAALVDVAGRVAAPSAAGADAIRALVATATKPAANPRGLAIGSPAPPVGLSDLSGRPFELTASNGRATLLLFWDMGCGFCRRMLPDLERWDAEHGGDDGGLVLVSAGAADDHHAMKLRSPVLLDSGFQVGGSYGASGTPSAVLVRQGRVASELAVGAPAVLGLLARLDQAAGPAS